jgi:hypothetical protein
MWKDECSWKIICLDCKINIEQMSRKSHVKMCIEPIIWSGVLSRTRHELFGFIKRALRSYFHLFNFSTFQGGSDPWIQLRFLQCLMIVLVYGITWASLCLSCFRSCVIVWISPRYLCECRPWEWCQTLSVVACFTFGTWHKISSLEMQTVLPS